MRSRRHYNSDAVYWPAFADIMTVLVVVLLCTFAAMKKTQPNPNGGDPGNLGPNGGHGSPLPLKTADEFKSAVLAGRRPCLLQALKTNSDNVLNESFQARLCSFSPASEGADSPNECLAALQKINEAFTHAPSLESVESRYSVRFGKLYLRANTGLGSPDADTLKKRLREGQDYLKTLTTGPFASFGLQNPEYAEQGPPNRPGEMTFGVNVGLASDLISRIDNLWKDKSAAELEEILKKSKSCEKIGG